MKTCSKCNTEKLFEEFYKHPKTKDGYFNKCKECSKRESVKKYKENSQNEEWLEKERKRTRERNIRLDYNNKYKGAYDRSKYMNRYKEKFPEKLEAKSAVSNIKRKKGLEFHHWSYNKEHYKDTIELTIRDHNKLHRFLVYDEKTFFYKDLEGNLLDTKEKHLIYWDKIK